MFHTEFIGTFMICLHVRFHRPSSNDSLVITIKPEATHRFHTATILFYILQKFTWAKVAYFPHSLPCIT
jgi:hypothetical protein